MTIGKLAFASAAGFLAAWPVNFWLLGRHMKKCH
jgi:biotin transporter BioY